MAMILAVVGGRNLQWTEHECNALRAIVRYLSADELWIGIDPVSGRDFWDATLYYLRRKAQRAWPLPVMSGSDEDATIAGCHRNEEMISALDEAFKAGSHVALVAFPGHTVTQHAVGLALRRSLPVIDLRSRPCP